MKKLAVQDLSKAFGFMPLIRDFIDSICGSRREANSENVRWALSSFNRNKEWQDRQPVRDVRDQFRIAANAITRMVVPQTTGRAYKPFLLHREPA